MDPAWNDYFTRLRQWEHFTANPPGVRPITTAKGRRFTVKMERATRGKIYYRVYDGKRLVGTFYVAPRMLRMALACTNASVVDKLQRKGIGSAVYDLIQNDASVFGLDLVPHGKYNLSPEGEAFWKKRDPAKYAQMLKDQY